MNFSIFESLMLVCFGIAWPVAIYKSYASKKTSGKSLLYLVIVFIGYLAGIIHKILKSNDFVMYLYILNAFMALIDISLYFRNKAIEKKQSN